MIAALKTRGVPIMWVGFPAIRGAKSTSDMSYLDELYRARADKAGIAYIDIWDGFVDDQGRFVQDGPDFEGQTRRLRTYDGVNFTKAGAQKLGHHVEHDLRRVLDSHMLPVALPGPEEQPPASDNVAGRPVIGPVVPLNATNAEKDGQLLGAAGHPTEVEANPLATRVLNRGEAVVAPRGRADDFSWPRPDISGTQIRRRFPMPCRPKERLPMAAQKMGRRTRTKLRQQSQVRQRVVRHSLHPRPMSRSLDRIITLTKVLVRPDRRCRLAPQLRIGDRVCDLAQRWRASASC